MDLISRVSVSLPLPSTSISRTTTIDYIHNSTFVTLRSYIMTVYFGAQRLVSSVTTFRSAYAPPLLFLSFSNGSSQGSHTHMRPENSFKGVLGGCLYDPQPFTHMFGPEKRSGGGFHRLSLRPRATFWLKKGVRSYFYDLLTLLAFTHL